MARISKLLVISAAAAAFLLIGMTVGSAQNAFAQDDDQAAVQNPGDLGGHAQVSNEPAAPLDVNGCWSGTLTDIYAGSGTGDVDFDQIKAKLRAPSNGDDMMDFTWADDSYAYGDGKGTATKRAYNFKVTYKSEKGCYGVVRGSLTDSTTMVGIYRFSKVCWRHNDFGPHIGSFTFTYDSTGSSCQ